MPECVLIVGLVAIVGLLLRGLGWRSRTHHVFDRPGSRLVSRQVHLSLVHRCHTHRLAIIPEEPTAKLWDDGTHTARCHLRLIHFVLVA